MMQCNAHEALYSIAPGWVFPRKFNGRQHGGNGLRGESPELTEYIRGEIVPLWEGEKRFIHRTKCKEK
jgi:hypothetical protein